MATNMDKNDNRHPDRFIKELFRTFDIKPGIEKEREEPKPQNIEYVEVDRTI